MKWLRQLNCDHEYFKVATEREVSNSMGVWNFYHTLYCPKCDKSVRLDADRAEILLKCREIKKEFNKSV